MGYPTGERQRIEGEKREGMESAIGAGGGEAVGTSGRSRIGGGFSVQ